MVKPKVKFQVNNAFNTTIPSQYSRIIGDKEYELKDHLGNVRVTLSDARENTTTAKVTSATSYLPFGSECKSKNGNYLQTNKKY